MHWSEREQSLHEGAFKPKKDEDLSVWHVGRLRARNVPLEDLLIENLTGFGQVHFKVIEYSRLANKVAEKLGQIFSIQVEWRPDDEYVDPPWRKWRYAHAQVEALQGSRRFPGRYRKWLAANSRCVIPPERTTEEKFI